MGCQAWKDSNFHILEVKAVVCSELSERLFYLKEYYYLNVFFIN